MMKILRVLLLVVHFVVLMLLFGTLLNTYVSPKYFPWLNLLSLGFPILISLHVFFTCIWLVLKKKRVIFFAISLLFFITPVRRWINYSNPPKDAGNLKILTFNIKAGILGVEKIEEYVAKTNADIILFQEHGAGENYVISSSYQNGEKYLFTSFYSKSKIINQKQIIGNLTSEIIADVSYADVEINGKIVRIFNIYLQPFHIEKKMVNVNSNQIDLEQATDNALKQLIPTFKDHQEQVDIIRKEIEQSPYPVIVAGDFNAVPNSYEYYQISNGLQDAFVKVGKGSGTSFHDFKIPLRIDYVFASKELQPISYTIDRSVHISDHFPVIVEYKID